MFFFRLVRSSVLPMEREQAGTLPSCPLLCVRLGPLQAGPHQFAVRCRLFAFTISKVAGGYWKYSEPFP